jgi:S-adenosylmethionine hydrolase
MDTRKPPAIVTLTTDFGITDHYVGTMKGVLLNRSPHSQIVDISHEIPPFSIAAGAYTVSQAVPYFPAGTIHVIVVDPGVGTARKPILLEALDQLFIAPDNGVLSLIESKDRHVRPREITNRNLWMPSPSNTFHGRDIFAPVAGSLAGGDARPEDVGPPLDEIEKLAGLQPEQIDNETWRGTILSVDHFGNVITSFRAGAFPQIAYQAFTLELGKRKITNFRTTFGGAPADLCFAYAGSGGYIEIGINQRSAAQFLGVKTGEAVLLRVTIV